MLEPIKTLCKYCKYYEPVNGKRHGYCRKPYSHYEGLKVNALQMFSKELSRKSKRKAMQSRSGFRAERGCQKYTKKCLLIAMKVSYMTISD